MPTPDRPGPHDYSRSRAVLIGSWDYEHLPPVPAAKHSLQRMRNLLCGELCGWPVDRVKVIANRSRPGSLHDELVELYEDTAADGVALFYFVGHGQPDDQDRLCLGLTGSRTEVQRRSSTSLRFDDVRDALRACPARTKIVILDCCFSGLAAQSRGSLSAGDVLDMTRGTGGYVMTASGAFRTAWFENDEGLARPLTYFTKYFADVVESGIPGQPAGLTLDSIFARVQDTLLRDSKPEPTSTARHEVGRFVFAHNSAAPDQEEIDEVRRLRTELAAATQRLERLEALQRQETETTPQGDEAAENDVIADAVAEAQDDHQRIFVALARQLSSADSSADPEVLVHDVSALGVSDWTRLRPEMEAIAYAPIAEFVAEVLDRNRRQRAQEVHALLSTAGRGRPLSEVAELVDALRAVGEAAVTERFPGFKQFQLSSTSQTVQMRELVLTAAAQRRIDEVIDLVDLLPETDIDAIVSTVGWSSPAVDVYALAQALRARGREADVTTLLRQAGRRDTEVPELMTLLDSAGQTDDIVSLLRAPVVPDLAYDARKHRRVLTKALRRTSLPRQTWRPLVRARTALPPVVALAILKVSLSGIVALLIGAAVAAGVHDHTFGWGNHIAAVVSAVLLVAAAITARRVASPLIWRWAFRYGGNRFHHESLWDMGIYHSPGIGPRSVPRWERILRSRGPAIVVSGVLFLSAALLSTSLATTVGGWLMWRF